MWTFVLILGDFVSPPTIKTEYFFSQWTLVTHTSALFHLKQSLSLFLIFPSLKNQHVKNVISLFLPYSINCHKSVTRRRGRYGFLSLYNDGNDVSPKSTKPYWKIVVPVFSKHDYPSSKIMTFLQCHEL